MHERAGMLNAVYSSPPPPRPLRLSAAASTVRASDGFLVTFPDGNEYKIPFSGRWDNWWEASFPAWHHETMEVFYAYLARGNFEAYFGFGEWIGPTALFSSAYVSRVFAIEPDPAAYSFLSANVAANPIARAKTHTSALCIATKTGVLTLSSSGGGDSESRIDSLVSRGISDNLTTVHPESSISIVEVPCVTLDVYVAEHEINLARTFIKVDCEGAEWSLLPSLTSIISALPAGRRPTLVISLHSVNSHEASLGALLDLARLFSYAGRWESIGDGPLPIKTSPAALTIDDLRIGGDIICSDYAGGA
jgi:hypothetical protein